jgi:hypothetical protein
MGVVGAGARRVLRVGALQARVGGAQCIRALGALRLVLDPALEIAQGARAEDFNSGRAATTTWERSTFNCAATSATIRIQSFFSVMSSMFLLEHE